MSLSTQTEKRISKIKAGLLEGLNYETIGAQCGVTKRTIDRDMKAFVESGEFETWVKQEWARMYAVIQREEPVEAFRNLTKLLGKMVTRKAEIKTSEEIKVEAKRVEIVGTLAEYENIIERALDRNLQENNTRKQVDPAQADAATS